MILYHFTADDIDHWDSIEYEGALRVTESNISMTKEHKGPDVVWLTANSDSQDQGAMLRGSDGRTFGSKTGIRITVDVPDGEVHYWPKWARQQGIKERWYRALAATPGANPRDWYVVMRPIPASEWVAIHRYKGFREISLAIPEVKSVLL